MRRTAIAAILLGGCGPQAGGDNVARPAPSAVEGSGWAFAGGSAEASMTFSDRGKTAIRLICPTDDGRLVVNVPAFRPIGSEERLSLGSGETVVALVADVRGDPERGGITASGPQPDEIKALLFTPLRASYGAQTTGPFPAVPADVQRPFVEACSASATAARQAASRPTAATQPCNVQDGQLLSYALRAVGTEPFWGVKIQGRCVTYSTPEDQAGTRIWTKVGTGPMGPVFVGNYQGKPFVLRVQPAVVCSDGMSDKKYDWEANLTVAGEQRKGCAETI